MLRKQFVWNFGRNPTKLRSISSADVVRWSSGYNRGIRKASLTRPLFTGVSLWYNHEIRKASLTRPLFTAVSLWYNHGIRKASLTRPLFTAVSLWYIHGIRKASLTRPLFTAVSLWYIHGIRNSRLTRPLFTAVSLWYNHGIRKASLTRPLFTAVSLYDIIMESEKQDWPGLYSQRFPHLNAVCCTLPQNVNNTWWSDCRSGNCSRFWSELNLISKLLNTGNAITFFIEMGLRNVRILFSVV